MSGLPDGSPAPRNGALPDTARGGLGSRPFGVYVHVPFCASRCGYCDFNTYTATELGGDASLAAFAETAGRELRLARRVLADVDLPAATVFFGGGTPTLLPPEALARVLDVVRGEFGLAPGAEVTTEANPESVDAGVLERLREAGFTRISLGMQSARAHVLAVLDRRHTPGRAVRAATEARAAGFSHISLDLIYGTPGETDDDWRESLEAAVGAEVDHVSAYSLTVETGTRLGARVRRGELPPPDDDTLADRYIAADEVLGAAGFTWYEISNWAAASSGRCRHNLGYWQGHDWWGVGPGAHSHVGGTRWWNVKHPAAYAARLAEGASPAQAREVLTADARHFERVMLGIRTAEGLPAGSLRPAGREAVSRLADDGLLDRTALVDGRLVLTRRGRLLADGVAAVLVD